jgi:hypothetical protein
MSSPRGPGLKQTTNQGYKGLQEDTICPLRREGIPSSSLLAGLHIAAK